MQPVAIIDGKNVQVVDPLDPQVLRLLQKRKPFWLTMPLRWPAVRSLGQRIDDAKTQQRRFDTLIIGAQSSLTYSRVRLKQESGEDFFSTEPIPIGAFTGYIGQYRQPYRWDTFLFVPGNTVIQAEAVLQETAPGSGTLEPDGGIWFEAISLV
jgi:hypothetical protein